MIVSVLSRSNGPAGKCFYIVLKSSLKWWCPTADIHFLSIFRRAEAELIGTWGGFLYSEHAQSLLGPRFFSENQLSCCLHGAPTENHLIQDKRLQSTDFTSLPKAFGICQCVWVYNSEVGMRQRWQEQCRSSLVNLNVFAPKITHCREPWLMHQAKCLLWQISHSQTHKRKVCYLTQVGFKL